VSFNPLTTWQRSRLVALHPGGRSELITQTTSRAVWALYCEIRERGLLPDTVALRIEVTAEHRSPFEP
jgi:hypothetical protein